MMPGQRTKSAEHDGKSDSAATANNDREENCQHSPPSICFMAFRQADAFHHNAPDGGNPASADRHDHERISRSAGETDDPKSGFETALRAAQHRQAKVQNSGPYKKPEEEHDWKTNHEDDGGEAEPKQPGKGIAMAQQTE